LQRTLVEKGKSIAGDETAPSPVIVEENIVFIVPEEKEAGVSV
jgi:hypothetical protein